MDVCIPLKHLCEILTCAILFIVTTISLVGLLHPLTDVLQQCFSNCYPILSSGENQEVCRSVLEASFFPAIISLLTIVYRCKNYRSEVAVARNMLQRVNASPKDLAVRKKYWLIEQVKDHLATASPVHWIVSQCMLH